MRIHLVCSEFDVRSEPGRPGWSGRGLQVRALAGALSDGGHEVAVICPRADGSAPVEQARSGPVVHHVAAGPDALRDYLTGLWRDAPPDVVHAFDGRSGVAAADAAAVAGSVLVQSFTTVNGVAGSAGDELAAQDVLLRRADRVVGTSDAQLEDMLRRGAPRSRLRIVPPGVDADVWHPDGESLRRNGTPRLVVVGSLEEGGGADDAIAALRSVPDAELYMAGGPQSGQEGDPDLTRLQELAARCGVGRRVRFLGAVAQGNVARLIRSADLVVCPSRQGGCGGTVLEAMACGRPVVATAAGSQRDIVVDGVTGVQVRLGQPVELGTAVRNLLADQPTRQAFGIAGRDRVLARYSWQRIAGAELAVYMEAMRELHPAPEPAVLEEADVEAAAVEPGGGESLVAS